MMLRAIEALERRVLFAVFTADPDFTQSSTLPHEDIAGTDTGWPGFLELLPSGKFLTGGLLLTANEVPQFRVARFNDDGKLDTTFNGDGLSPTIPLPDFGGSESRGVLQSDGKIVLATNTDDGIAVARFNADGSIDTTFGGGDGLAFADNFGIVSADSVLANPRVAVTADGKIVVTRDDPQRDSLFVNRFLADGTPDNSFSGDGQLVINQDDIVDQVTEIDQISSEAVAALAGNKILILAQLGNTSHLGHRPALIQLNSDGSYDSSFGGGDGKLPFFFRAGDFGSMVGDMLVQGDGKIVVAGYQNASDATDGAALARFNANGTPDTAFGTNGVGIVATPRLVGVLRIVQDDQGRFVASTGDIGSIDRWTTGGDPDITFGTRGHADFNINSPILAFDDDGRMLSSAAGALQRNFITAENRPPVELGSNGVLLITGDLGDADNTITVASSGSNIVVTRNGVQSTFPAANVDRIDLLTFNGDDDVTVTATLSGLFDLGDGDNSISTAPAGGSTITSGAGKDTIEAGEGFNTIDSGAGDDSITLDGDLGSRVDAGEGNDTITGSDGDDEINGDAGSDQIQANGGDDIVYGFHWAEDNLGAPTGGDDGANVIDGGDGDDYLVGGDGRDTIHGGAQRDIIIGYASSDLLVGGGGKDKIAGAKGPDRINGGAGDDQLDGGDAGDRIAGGGGDDKIFGGAGSDILAGDAGDDRFFAQDSTSDTVDGGSGDNFAVNSDDDDEILNGVLPA